MDAEIMSRVKIRDIQREVRRIHLASAALGKGRRRATGADPNRRPAPAMPLRLLRAFRHTS